MLKYFAKKEKGFTLMELLIAVGIMAVLAGVGVPLYLKLQTGAKATEANVHLDSIRTCLESYKLVNNSYLDCAVAPRAVVDQDPVAWGVAPGFDDIGFAPTASVRFAYEVAGASSTGYIAGALGDTDGDATHVLYTATEGQGPQPQGAEDATLTMDDGLAISLID